MTTVQHYWLDVNALQQPMDVRESPAPYREGGMDMTLWATASNDGEIDPDVLAEVVRRVVEMAQPEKIILFGSAARGDMNRHSDVDLLVIKEGDDSWTVMGDIYENLCGVGAALDDQANDNGI